MNSSKHQQFTKKRRKVQVRRRKALARKFLGWVSALTTVFALAKLVVELIEAIARLLQ